MKRHCCKLFLILLVVLGLGTSTAQAAFSTYTNSFYAIESYSERDYTAYSDQVALGWGQVRKYGDSIYFSQQKFEPNPRRSSEYGVPTGDIQSLVRGMKDKGSRLMLSVYLADSRILREILNSDILQQTIIEDMVKGLQGIPIYDYSGQAGTNGVYPYVLATDAKGNTMGYDGLVIDFEELFDYNSETPDISYRSRFTAFIQNLRQAMPQDKALSIALHPKRQRGITYYDGHDYKAIGAAVDQVFLMAHDYQWKDGSIKATAPYDLVREAIEFAVLEIPKEKILLQISLGPVQWRNGNIYRPKYTDMLNAIEGRNPNQSVLEVTPPAQRFNSRLKVGYTYLRRAIYEGGVLKEVVEDTFYYETSLSIAYKRHLAAAYGLQGLSLWRLGMGAEEAVKGYFQLDAIPVDVNANIPDEAIYTRLESSGSTVAPTKEWNIKFNGVVDPRTLQNNISLWKSEGSVWTRVAISSILDPKDDRNVIVIPDIHYSPGTYKLFIGPSVKTITGTSMKKGVMMSFKVQ